jgi:hypothetical protein
MTLYAVLRRLQALLARLMSIRAHDASDATVESTVLVHVDTEAPHATFTPAAGAIVHGVDTITASDVSPDTTQIMMYGWNNTEVVRASTAPWTLTWDTTNQRGPVRFAVTDRGGNVTESSRTYVVDNYGPKLGLEFGGIPSLRAYDRAGNSTTTTARTWHR